MTQKPAQSPIEIAIDALERIQDPVSARKDSPGRTWSYRDYELRQIAKHALERMRESVKKLK